MKFVFFISEDLVQHQVYKFVIRPCPISGSPVRCKFLVLVYRNPHPATFLFLNFFLNVGKGPLTVTGGPLSATFPTLA